MSNTSIKLVIEILKKQNYSPSPINENYSEIQWIDESEDRCFIEEDFIDHFADNIAWFQSSDNDRHILKIYNKNTEFSWIPITHNPIYGCIPILVKWYGDTLLFIYKEKHDIYICSIHNESVNHINYYGDELMINKNLLAYTEYKDIVSLIKIPELIPLENISKEKAKEMDLVPVDIRELDHSVLKTK
ncbi:hypothetical protein [uncultured Tenacibaculum sp.]|uniref:hypothetical protein n=1 Tax=uncultured Tenacibaculum sp. TaxID=174713 RepID=UPI002615B0D1|nr:hypothetical protein [uncultured Tenacibaculum sp.]